MVLALASTQSVAQLLQGYVNFSLQHFLPESILIVGFLIAVLLAAMEFRHPRVNATAYFSIAILILAGLASALEWVPFNPAAPRAWTPGTQIFPLSNTLFPPTFEHGIMSGYGSVVVDNFAVFFKLLVSLAGIFVLWMSIGANELQSRRRHLGEYSALILGMSVGLYVMPAANDLLTMYIALELVSIAGYILTGFSKERNRSSEAALKYVLFGAIASGCMIYGFSLIHGLTGSTNLIAIRQVLALSIVNHAASNLNTLWVATALAMVGIGYKVSAVPFHFWTPDVYEGAPTPITAYLSVASKAAGFGLLIRFVIFLFPDSRLTNLPVIDWPMMLAVLAVITMTVGNLTAIFQSNVKRLLAYSSIAHAGYMLAALAVHGAEGIVAVMIYLATYLLMNLGAFYTVMLIQERIGSEELDDYRGIGRRSVLTSASLAIFLVSLAGIPLTAGFIGKFYIFTALLSPQPPHGDTTWLWLAVVVLANSLVAVYYYLRVIGAMYLKRSLVDLANERAHRTSHDEPRFHYPLNVRMLVMLLVVPTVALGIYFQPLVDFASGVIRFFSFQNVKF